MSDIPLSTQAQEVAKQLVVAQDEGRILTRTTLVVLHGDGTYTSIQGTPNPWIKVALDDDRRGIVRHVDALWELSIAGLLQITPIDNDRFTVQILPALRNAVTSQFTSHSSPTVTANQVSGTQTIHSGAVVPIASTASGDIHQTLNLDPTMLRNREPDLSPKAVYWARLLTALLEAGNIEEEFELLDATAGHANTIEVVWGLGANSVGENPPPIGILKQLAAENLLRIVEVPTKTNRKWVVTLWNAITRI